MVLSKIRSLLHNCQSIHCYKIQYSQFCTFLCMFLGTWCYILHHIPHNNPRYIHTDKYRHILLNKHHHNLLNSLNIPQCMSHHNRQSIHDNRQYKNHHNRQYKNHHNR